MFDAGTGARALGERLIKNAQEDPSMSREAWVLFSHLHADHVFGFPFFAPLYSPSWRVHVGVPAWSEPEAREKLGRYVNGTFFPLRLHELPGPLDFQPIAANQRFSFGPWDLEAVRLAHPGGSMGYRVRHGDRGFAYITDTAPFAAPDAGLMVGAAPTAGEERLIRFLQGCDLVVFDTMFELDVWLTRMHFGHSYPEYAIALCKAAGVKRLALFHHAPDDDDDALDRRQERFSATEGLDVFLAREGASVEL